VVNRRALRTLDVGTFKERAGKAKTIREAMDDGFEDYTETGNDRRPELDDCEMLIVGWQLRPGARNREFARVWALVETETGEVAKVKFSDAGGGNIVHPGISATLRDMEDNGTTGDVRVVFRMERYPFFDSDGAEQTGIRYWIEDVNPADNDAREAQTEDKPDF
jgi:hypothetical protein